ncbi:MAG: hypothetical protein QGG87_06500, partial [Nitrospinota bacterium]|nr:hypothetical protein [Nitrospinota bacterium]
MKRIITAIVFLPVFFLIVQYGNSAIFFIFFSLILLAALFEFYTLLIQNGQRCMLYAGMILGWLVGFSFLSNQNHLMLFSMVISVTGMFI